MKSVKIKTKANKTPVYLSNECNDLTPKSIGLRDTFWFCNSIISICDKHSEIRLLDLTCLSLILFPLHSCADADFKCIWSKLRSKFREGNYLKGYHFSFNG